MQISVEVLAQMIGVKSGELIYAIKTDGLIKGHKPPKPSTHGSGANMRFDLNKALAFEKKVADLD